MNRLTIIVLVANLLFMALPSCSSSEKANSDTDSGSETDTGSDSGVSTANDSDTDTNRETDSPSSDSTTDTTLPTDSGEDTETHESGTDSNTGIAVRCTDDPCGENTTCSELNDGIVCECLDGYEGNAVVGCTDINECLDSPCDAATQCTNYEGTYICSNCPAGYEGDPASGCTDVNECKYNNGGCDPLTVCVNSVGSFACGACPSGYTGDGASGCADVNECTDNDFPCGINAVCTNTAGSFECACLSGFEGNAMLGCADIDECATAAHSCDENAVCSNTTGRYKCACNTGFSGNGFECADINECELGTYTCDANQICANTTGSYACVCNEPAWENDGNGGCMDANECAKGIDNCSVQATCSNTVGSFICSCNSGWEGNGVSCTDVNECLNNNGGCDLLTTCTNTEGGRVCGSCPSGYSGNGVTGCSDINECTAGIFTCNTNASCLNTDGGYDCICNEGFIGTADACRELRGHVVLSGHDNYELSADTSRILANAVALANTTENIDILAVTEFVSASGPEKTNTTNAIATGLAEMGRTYTLAELTDMNQIATGAIDLLNYDVVIFYEQEQTDAATMESFGATIETQLKTFVTSNGVLIACDGSGHETSALFRGADVLDVSGGASATDDTLTVVDTSDLLASGISESYIGPSTTRSYDAVSNDTVVVEDATGRPVVFHREGDMSWEWVFIPAGNFDMGSTEGQSDELPVHAVSVPAFYMNRTEVTVASYQKCVTTGPCTVPDDGSTALNWNVANRDEYPINGVTVAQAEVFCAWAGGRLPSEAEWEYAAKNAGQDVRFPWGSTMPSCDYTVMKATSNGCNTGLTMPVCSKEAGNTTQGLCDMIGNVWEFVADKITTNYIGAPTDGSVWENNGGTRPTIRGASMDNPNTGVPSTVTLTTTYRHAIDSDETRYNVGFRCARDIQQ